MYELISPYFVTFALILVLFGATMLIALYSTFAERKVAAFMQDRLGPKAAIFLEESLVPAQFDRDFFVYGKDRLVEPRKGEVAIKSTI